MPQNVREELNARPNVGNIRTAREESLESFRTASMTGPTAFISA